ncbi:MAG: hypothetical protein ABSH20_15935 [Tepidisphaeraceae bacterium]|jgi:hypothetical protein
MQLFLESTFQTVENPTDADIARLLPEEREFAILSDGPDSLTYMQFAWSEEPGELLLEYQEGTLYTHFRAIGAEMTIDRIVAAFQKYAQGDDSWKGEFRWEHVTV